MEHRLVDSTQQPESFFNALPADWQEGIVPYWADYQHTARIFTFQSGTEILGGGIVFSTVSPDTQEVYQQEAQRWFDEGYLYIGFLWFSEQHRGKQLGTKWLEQVFARHPRQKFWLAIDEFRLSSFYIRNGFSLIEKIESAEGEEWVLTMDCQERRPAFSPFSKEPQASAIQLV